MSSPEHDHTASTAEVDELSARRARRRPGQPVRVDHRTRRDYSSVLALLADADRLLADLTAPGDEQLLVPIDELSFTSRRLQALLDAATVELRRLGGA